MEESEEPRSPFPLAENIRAVDTEARAYVANQDEH